MTRGSRVGNISSRIRQTCMLRLRQCLEWRTDRTEYHQHNNDKRSPDSGWQFSVRWCTVGRWKGHAWRLGGTPVLTCMWPGLIVLPWHLVGSSWEVGVQFMWWHTGWQGWSGQSPAFPADESIVSDLKNFSQLLQTYFHCLASSSPNLKKESLYLLYIQYIAILWYGMVPLENRGIMKTMLARQEYILDCRVPCTHKFTPRGNLA